MSEIIATLLMIVAVVALSGVLFVFASNGLSGLSSGFSNMLSSSGNSLSEQIVIEQITFNETTMIGSNIYVRNVGSTALSVAAVYVQNALNNTLVGSFQLVPNVQINAGAFQNIAVRFTPTRGTTYGFTVATSAGNTVLTYAKA